MEQAVGGAPRPGHAEVAEIVGRHSADSSPSVAWTGSAEQGALPILARVTMTLADEPTPRRNEYGY
jgi:hypothetical protein